tara:strand:- start:2587 stop:3759 length:1173 start_codon:yes stop_codon:yes gene_type:complete
MNKSILIEKTKKYHSDIYDILPDVISFAPGRIEVLGNHTDYNQGVTLSVAIDQGVCFTISSSKKNSINVKSINFNESILLSTTCNDAPSKYGWANYIRGILYYFNKNNNIKLQGMNCTFYGSIPMGSGLSSSAALEISLLFALQKFYKTSMDLKYLAKIGQLAEQNFAGCQCGLLDQYSSIFGIKNGFIHTNFKTNEISQIEINNDIVFLVINSNIQHELTNSPYNNRRQDCKNAVNELNKLLPKKINSLADISYNEFELNSKSLSPRSFHRAKHIIGENDRVFKAISYLNNNELKEFGNLLYESHESSKNDFENSCKELDQIVVSAKDCNALGARLSGGGWGGSVIVLTNKNDADDLLEKMILLIKNKNINPTGNIIYPSEGAKIIEEF